MDATHCKGKEGKPKRNILVWLAASSRRCWHTSCVPCKMPSARQIHMPLARYQDPRPWRHYIFIETKQAPAKIKYHADHHTKRSPPNLTNPNAGYRTHAQRPTARSGQQATHETAASKRALGTSSAATSTVFSERDETSMHAAIDTSRCPVRWS